MTKVLYLPLKKQWFDMIASGEKKEEYREIKPYWNKRFHKCGIDCTPTKFYGDCQELIGNEVVNSFPCYKCEWSELLKFDYVIFRNGYGKNVPEMGVELKGIKVGKGRSEWGAPEENVYVLELGRIMYIPETEEYLKTNKYEYNN